ncbi:MAG: penicillin-binding protein [Bacilli bacterium]|nr:penicillin-binding protein [Bacilli bacterium]
MKIKGNTIQINFLFVIVIVLLFCAIVWKLCVVALNDVVEGINIRELADSRIIATKTIYSTRGTIYDNSGEAVAENVNSYIMVAVLSSQKTTNPDNPKHVVDYKRTAEELSNLFLSVDPKSSMTYEYILQRLNTKGAYQVEFGMGGKNISETMKNKIQKLNLPGIEFTKTFKRYYQNGDFASYLIGYAVKKQDDNGNEYLVGELGIEGYCDRYLKGKDGYITYEKDAQGYQLADRPSYGEDAQDGYDIYLTLDKQVQMFVDTAVDEFNQHNPAWTSITIAKADSGAIIASSSSPSFDPNKLNISDYLNPMTSYTYEPGSTMKIFSFMSAMEEGIYKGDEKYKTGSIQVDEYNISDWNKKGWGMITYDKGFTYSSNVAAVMLAQALGRNTLKDYYSKLGLGKQTGIELANEAAGTIDFQYASELASVSYGQGMTVTPIQMIQALTTITNDGVMLKPYVIDKIVNPNTGEVEYQGKRTEVRKIFSSKTTTKIVELMDLTVNSDDPVATGKRYASSNVKLIGKTGTANYIDSKTGQYAKGDRYVIRSFAGIFPKDNPEYIIYVVTKDFDGGAKEMGASIKKLVESVAKYKNIEDRLSDKDPTKIVKIGNYQSMPILTATKELNEIGVTPIIVGNGSNVIKQFPAKNTTTSIQSKVFLLTNGDIFTMPDVKNYSSKDVIELCNLIGLKYTLNGFGYVESTTIEPGTEVHSGDNIVINLKNIEPESLIDKET